MYSIYWLLSLNFVLWSLKSRLSVPTSHWKQTSLLDTKVLKILAPFYRKNHKGNSSYYIWRLGFRAFFRVKRTHQLINLSSSSLYLSLHSNLKVYSGKYSKGHQKVGTVAHSGFLAERKTLCLNASVVSLCPVCRSLVKAFDSCHLQNLREEDEESMADF